MFNPIFSFRKSIGDYGIEISLLKENFWKTKNLYLGGHIGYLYDENCDHTPNFSIVISLVFIIFEFTIYNKNHAVKENNERSL